MAGYKGAQGGLNLNLKPVNIKPKKGKDLVNYNQVTFFNVLCRTFCASKKERKKENIKRGTKNF